MVVYVVGLAEKQALRWLADAVQADTAPALTTRELRDLLVDAATADADGNAPDRWDRWQANDVVAVGDRVVPVPRTGYVYVATVAGQTGPTAPAWPTAIDATVADGGVTWRVEDTAPWLPTYCPRRLNRAAAAGWRLKKGKRTDLMTISAGGSSVDPRSFFDACDRMIAAYARKGGGGTINLGGSVYADYPVAVELVS